MCCHGNEAVIARSAFFPGRILSVLVTCLDSLLFLQSKYNFLETLLALQRDNVTQAGAAEHAAKGSAVLECSVLAESAFLVLFYKGVLLFWMLVLWKGTGF